MEVLISACLLGLKCRYDGHSAPAPAVEELLRRPGLHFVPVCPEQLGGLPTPRESAERVGERILTRSGADVTAPYRRGAEGAASLAARLGCTCALLKARSPSCGSGRIYDGTFTGALVPGDGVAAAALKGAGLAVFDEEHLPELLAYLEKGEGT